MSLICQRLTEKDFSNPMRAVLDMKRLGQLGEWRRIFRNAYLSPKLGRQNNIYFFPSIWVLVRHLFFVWRYCLVFWNVNGPSSIEARPIRIGNQNAGLASANTWLGWICYSACLMRCPSWQKIHNVKRSQDAFNQVISRPRWTMIALYA